MSNQKRHKKALDFSWIARPYEATWAHSPDEVPVWDCSRDYPLELPDGYLTDYHFATMNELLDEYDVIGIQNDVPIDLKYMRLIARAPGWSPWSPPFEGYPRLVRANYVDYLELRDCSGIDIINPLAQLLRHAPKPYGKQVLDEVAALNAMVGPVNDPRENTLASWLKLAQEVKAHLMVRRILYESDYATMCNEVLTWYYSYRAAPKKER